MKVLAEITKDALELPLKERFTLARILLSGSEADDDVESAWEDEICRRMETVEAGTAVSRSAAEVFADLDRRLSR